MVKLVITDLDDTLYSWIGFFIPAFYDMVHELSLIIHVPQEELLKEYKAIHQEMGSVEFPFATLNLPSVKKKYCGITDEQVKVELDSAFHKFNSTRKKLLKLYPEVEDTLDVYKRQILMTLHSAKGLEFPHVYLAGMEDGLFPSYMTITSDDNEDLEEERRLCYVGITRAEKDLTVSCARRRMIRGETQYNKMSRFLKEIPAELMEAGTTFAEETEMPTQNAYFQAKQVFKQKAFSTGKTAKQFTVTKEKGLDYTIGDRVKHMKFGEGLVTDITEGGRDYEVTVQFDAAGVKKMFASFARLQKV